MCVHMAFIDEILKSLQDRQPHVLSCFPYVSLAVFCLHCTDYEDDVAGH